MWWPNTTGSHAKATTTLVFGSVRRASRKNCPSDIRIAAIKVVQEDDIARFDFARTGKITRAATC